MSQTRILRDNLATGVSPQRESRIHSIYEKYLYDPKDLDSKDPKIRALARKASKDQQHNHPRQQHDAPAMSTKAAKKRQSSVMFARGTKGQDDDRPSMPRGSTGSAYDGFGALMDAYSDDSDSDDSDDERHRPVPSSSMSSAPSKSAYPADSVGDRSRTRESWSARAQAVGERPPDSASQNPPTLKLLGLKSQKEGGAPIGGSAPQAHPSAPRGPTTQQDPTHPPLPSEYDERASRTGSTIHFTGQQGHAGHGSDGFGGTNTFFSNPAPPSSFPANPRSPPQAAARSPQAAHHDSRIALTTQLGLDTPRPDRQPSPIARGQPHDDYFSRNNPQANHEVLLQRSTTNDDSPFGGGPRSPESAMVRPAPPRGQASYGGSSAGSPPRDPFSDRAAGRPLVSPPRGGGPPQMSLQGRSPPRPSPSAAPSGFQPRADPVPGPGFSDARPRPQQQRRQSIFRRSMAFMTGNGGPQPPENNGPLPRPSREGNNNRQSLFRRSMAFFGGPKPAPPPAAAPPEPDDANCPAPRVRGFNEKDAVDRRSQYWGGGGQGSEWDTDGAGSKFWRRFSAAQKHADNPADKMETTSRTLRQKVVAQKKAATWLAGVGGVLIIAAVVAIIIWREGKSGTSDDNPGSINKGNFGGTDSRQRRSPARTPLPGVEVEHFQSIANAAVWERANVSPSVERAEEEDDGAAPAATPAASPQTQRSMRRRAKRHANMSRRMQASEQVSAGHM